MEAESSCQRQVRPMEKVGVDGEDGRKQNGRSDKNLPLLDDEESCRVTISYSSLSSLDCDSQRLNDINNSEVGDEQETDDDLTPEDEMSSIVTDSWLSDDNIDVTNCLMNVRRNLLITIYRVVQKLSHQAFVITHPILNDFQNSATVILKSKFTIK